MNKNRSPSFLESDLDDLPRCPDCGSSNPVPIRYGFPSAEMREEAQQGRIILGWCVVEPADWVCRYCLLNWPVVDPRPWKGTRAELSLAIAEAATWFALLATETGPVGDRMPLVERYWERGDGRRTFLVRFPEGVARVEKRVEMVAWGGVPEYRAQMSWKHSVPFDADHQAAMVAVLSYERTLCPGLID